MDPMFDDDVTEIGAEIDAYCTKCRADGPHTVITKYEDELRSVQCNICSSVHAYRPPRGAVDDDIPEPIAVKRRQSLQKLSWHEAVQSLDPATAQPYDARQAYPDGTLVDHPKFGLGYVSEVLADHKIEVTFKDGRRVLVHGRADFPAPRHAKGARAAAVRRATAARVAAGQAARQAARAGARSRTAAKRPAVPRRTVGTPKARATRDGGRGDRHGRGTSKRGRPGRSRARPARAPSPLRRAAGSARGRPAGPRKQR